MSDANYDYIANAGGPRPNTISNVGGISPPPPPPPAPSWVPRAPSGNVATVFIGFATDQYWAGGATQTIAMLEGNIGAAFRHRDYITPLVFIFAAAGIVNVYRKIKEQG